MCLVVLAWQRHPDFPLIIAGNRDEFHARPTARARWWSDAPDILGGRDLQAGGSWLALHRGGRFATVTNFRDAQKPSSNYRSRGHLVTAFLRSAKRPINFLNAVDSARYAGFNMLVSDGTTLAWLSNRGGDAHVLAPGVYGLSNALLDSPWHKVVRSKLALAELVELDKINETELFRLLADREKAPIAEVGSSRLSFATAHAISAPFIVLPDYGTRSSSVVLLDSAGSWRFNERRFAADGNRTGESAFAFTPEKRAAEPAQFSRRR